MRHVFSLGFLGDASAKSYTLAGAFITWLGETYGFDTVRAWYAGGDVERLTRLEWSALDRAFRDALGKQPLPDEAESFARAKFARPGLFGRRCPHVVDALRHEADVCRDTQRFADAIRLYGEAVAKDALDFASSKELATVQRRHGDRAAGQAKLEAMAAADDRAVPRTWRDRAEEALADADFVDGAYERAATRYQGLAARSVDEDVARTLEVKALGASVPLARETIRAFLIGDAKRGPDIFLAGVQLGVWGSAKPAGLASYLEGRNLVGRGFFEVGAVALDRALAEGLPTPRIARETLRQRAIAACALSDRGALAALRARVLGPDDPWRGVASGRREATLRLIDRCAR
jgi:hypothetical protein